jgi:hypothetical protein
MIEAVQDIMQEYNAWSKYKFYAPIIAEKPNATIKF